MVAPLLVLPASQVKVGTNCAEALATPKSMPSNRPINPVEFFIASFKNLKQPGNCSLIFVGVVGCFRDSVFIGWVGVKRCRKKGFSCSCAFMYYLNKIRIAGCRNPNEPAPCCHAIAAPDCYKSGQLMEYTMPNRVGVSSKVRIP